MSASDLFAPSPIIDNPGEAVTITEETRYRLYKKLEATLGADDANTLMEHLPPVGWADVATKTDLDHLRAVTGADIDGLRTELKADIESVRVAVKADIDGLRTEMKADIDGLRTEMKADIDGLRTEMQAFTTGGLEQLEVRMDLKWEAALARTAHSLFIQMIASTAALMGVAVAVNQLLSR
ncbi:MAG: hypothetical protein ACOYOP_13200 [Microthrixaceae bacterium]